MGNSTDLNCDWRRITMSPHRIFWTACVFACAAAAADSVDYIVVGGGTAGLLVANRLSANSDNGVAVIDPGTDERDKSGKVKPIDWVETLGMPVARTHGTVPQENANNRELALLTGQGIGGTSLINGTLPGELTL